MYCPSCSSHYVGLSFPKDNTDDTYARCRLCGHTWRTFDEKGAHYIPMLDSLMKETFDKTT